MLAVGKYTTQIKVNAFSHIARSEKKCLERVGPLLSEVIMTHMRFI